MITHREALRQAFRDLRELGITARMSFSCCSSCGHYELTADKHYPYVFWNRQSDIAFAHRQYHRGAIRETLFDTLNLQWYVRRAVCRPIVETLQAHGLHVEWDGTHEKCIQVLETAVKERI